MNRLWNALHRARRLVQRYVRLHRAERRALWRATRWIIAVRSALEVTAFRHVLAYVESRAQAQLQAGQATHAGLETERGGASSSGVSQGENSEAAHSPSGESAQPAQLRASERSEVSAEHTPLLSNPEATRTVWAVRAVGRRLMPERPCLTQALVGRLLLARDGIDATLHIGVTKAEDVLKAHAWLEYGDVIILGGRRSREEYRAFPALNA